MRSRTSVVESVPRQRFGRTERATEQARNSRSSGASNLEAHRDGRLIIWLLNSWLWSLEANSKAPRDRDQPCNWPNIRFVSSSSSRVSRPAKNLASRAGSRCRALARAALTACPRLIVCTTSCSFVCVWSTRGSISDEEEEEEERRSGQRVVVRPEACPSPPSGHRQSHIPSPNDTNPRLRRVNFH